MNFRSYLISIGVISVLCASASAVDLTMMVETELAALGCKTGPVDGEETMETVIAISKFQAENQLEVTGEVTPQLAGVLSARTSDIYSANATVDDLAAAAKDLGQTEDDVAACQNPR